MLQKKALLILYMTLQREAERCGLHEEPTSEALRSALTVELRLSIDSNTSKYCEMPVSCRWTCHDYWPEGDQVSSLEDTQIPSRMSQ